MKRACLVVVVSIVLVAAAGCGKSNRKTAYHPPTTQTSTQAATGNADQEDAVAKSNARNLVSGVEACFVDQQTYTSCKKPAEKLVSAFASKADYTIKVPAKEPFRAPATTAPAAPAPAKPRASKKK